MEVYDEDAVHNAITEVLEKTRAPRRRRGGPRGILERQAEQLALEAKGEKPKRFIHNQKVLLTYKTHIDKEELRKLIESRSGRVVKFYRAAHENGDETDPYEHTHVVVDFGSAVTSNDVRLFDYGEIHPNMNPLKTQTHFRNAKKYLAKEDIDNEDLLEEERPIAEGIWECASKQEALKKYVKRPSDTGGVIQMYDAKPKVAVRSQIHKARRWQKELKKRLEKEVSESEGEEVLTDDEDKDKMFEFDSGPDRKIIVIHDPVGKTGKTWLMKELVIADPVKYFAIGSMGSTRDMATVMHNALIGGWSGDTLLIGLTRTKADHAIYDPLEQMRDGMMTVTKYQGGACAWEPRNVVMLTNWMPKLEALTMDRWEIYAINPTTKYLVRIPTRDAEKIYKEEALARKAQAVANAANNDSDPLSFSPYPRIIR